MIERRTVGKTGLSVCRIGLSSAGITDETLDYAVGQGLNFIFHSTDLHAFAYQSSINALRRYCKRGSSLRDSIVLAACSYVNAADKVHAVLVDQIYTLGVDHVDIFLWGWVSGEQRPNSLLTAANRLKNPSSRAFVDNMIGRSREEADRIRSAGYARFVGISTHDRQLASQLYRDGNIDVLMVRYNIAHRGAETDVFEALQPGKPGIIVFNATHNSMGSFAGQSLPHFRQPVTHEELYQFVLARREVDVVLASLQNKHEIDRALAATRLHLQEQRCVELRAIGDVIRSEWHQVRRAAAQRSGGEI